MGPSRGMPQDTATRGRMTPLFWGGSLPSSAFLPRPQREGRFKTAKHKRLRQIEESGFAALLVLPMPYPPLCERGIVVRSGRHKKTADCPALSADLISVGKADGRAGGK